MTSKIPTILESIVAKRRTHLADIRNRIAHVDISTLPQSRRSLFDSLNKGRGGARFIMECKSASPSLGLIRSEYRPGDIAQIYSRYASGISVLCEPERFNGDYDHLATVAASTHLPVLCKDFIIDKIQIHAARYFGADAVLLMLSVLDDATYSELAAEAHRFGMDVLTEVVDEEEISRAIRLGAKIFGINNRDLHDLSIDLRRTKRLAPLIPEAAVVISESGIRDHATVRELGSYANGFLVGSQLTGQPDIDQAARELVYGGNKVCGLRTSSAAQAARAAGALYGGLIFEEGTPRNVSRETALEIINSEPGLRYVAVSRRSSGYAELIHPGVRAVQIHSPLQPHIEGELELINQVRAEIPADIEVWRALSMNTERGASFALSLAEHVDKLVLDSAQGGSGTSFDWHIVPEMIKDKSLLAGGIRFDNLSQALAIGCSGLDINSGAEYPASSGQWVHHKDSAQLTRIFSTIQRFHNDA